jgi:transcriptional regulator of NAD metabolism
MNERIQELLLEAHRQTKGGIYSGHPSEWSEKFAKLIVQECANICDDLQNIPATEPRHCAEDIRIHFGVDK